MDVRITSQPDGAMLVSTSDGVNLVGGTYAQISYLGGGTNGTYGNITIQDYNTAGQPLGTTMPLDPHLSGGSLKGMIDMRDQTLGGLAQTLGNFAMQTANAVNQ